MTKVPTSPILAALALAASFAAASGPVAADASLPTSAGRSVPMLDALAARSVARPGGLVAEIPAQTKAGSDFCGNGEILVIYDEDANGNRIPGTERYDCVYD